MLDKIPEIHTMEKSVLSYLLTRFVMEIKNEKGEDYPPKTLYLIMCGLLRYLRECGVHDLHFLDKKDPAFVEFYTVLDSKKQQLLHQGFGTDVKQTDPVSSKLWKTGIFGMQDAKSLQLTVFFYACKLFGLRGRDEHRTLECNQFEIGEDAEGQYIKFIGRGCKTYKGGLGQMSLANKEIKHYCKPGPRSVATHFGTYLNALGNEGDFYRRLLLGDTIRYGNHAVSVNTLGEFMKEIAGEAGLKGNYSNHSGKRTCATSLYDSGIDEQETMSRTGHRFTTGVRKYKKTSIKFAR